MGIIPQGMKNIGNIQDTLKQASEKQGESARILIEQNKEILEALNDITKAVVSLYQNDKVIAKKFNIKLPEPLTKMELEG